MATGISFLNDKSGDDFPRIFQEEKGFQKDRERVSRAKEFRNRMKDHCRGLNNNQNSSDDDIIIIDNDDSPVTRKQENQKRTKRSSIDPPKNDDQNDSDEILARQLQEEFDQEYAVSLEFNGGNNLNTHIHVNNNNQNIQISHNFQNNSLNDIAFTINDQNLLFGRNSNRREIANNDSGLANEFNFLQNNQFMTQFLDEDVNTGDNNTRFLPEANRRARRYIHPVRVRPNRTQHGQLNQFFQTDRDFTSDDYESLIRLDEQNSVKKCLRKEEVQSLPCFPFKENNLDQQENQCSICFDSYLKDEKIMSLACLHKFHAKCVKEWLKASRKCPLCQKDAIHGN
ncbi:phosphatidylinositol transfer [Brachionus plicatilis]|uniref:Phosphatidylinositol transfer n=1 Tax=Brachionus plicatilis TaxID=10195 RepID=A0A3M7QEQ4_BRAPC|nr:phosphatidylinositol transfer [Brachionus plicatilis]